MTDFTGPEAEFCIAVLASELQEQPGTVRAPENIDWEAVAVFLENNRLAAHFYTLGQKNPGLFPQSLRERLKQARYANLLYGDKCRLEVSQVLSALKQADIPVIVMKGWAVIQWLYNEDHGQRFCEDIDILVPLEKIDQAEEILVKLKYAGMDEVHPGYTRRFYNCQAYTRNGTDQKPASRFSIGLHWGLTHYPYYDKNQVNIPELFERAHPLRVAGVDVLELGFEDQLIYTCAHLALHHRNEETLLNYYEIAAIFRRAGTQLDWNVLTARAQKWRYLVQVQGVLAQLDRLWPGLIAPDVLERLNQTRAPWRERLNDWMVAVTKVNGFRSGLVELLAMPGIPNKFSSAFHQVFPDKDYMVKRYNLPASQSLIQLYAARLSLALKGLEN